MAKYGDGDKRIWITEIGWPTHRNNSQLLGVIVRSGLKAIDAQKTNWTLAVF
jgi:exo-beta-1,3-glucanase (GH17 family)